MRNVITRRVLKMLEDESKRDKKKYNLWHKDFSQFLKEGLTMDQDNKDAILRLMRYKGTFTNDEISLDEYVAKMKEDQTKIYYAVTQERQSIEDSPFYDPFKGSDVPVLILTNNVDEICFQQIQDYKGKTFVNIENSYEEVSKDLKHTENKKDGPRVSEDDITPFSLWLKNELQENVNKVTISKRLTGSPAVLFGQVSSSMRVIMQMMDQQ